MERIYFMNVNFDGKVFRSQSNSENGEVGEETRFYYHQEGNLVWAEYNGGEISKGHLLGTVAEDGVMQFAYVHVNMDNKIKTGNCKSTPRIEDGKLVIKEEWQWTCDDFSSGESEIIEV